MSLVLMALVGWGALYFWKNWSPKAPIPVATVPLEKIESISKKKLSPELLQQFRRVDPSKDGWQSEAQNDVVGRQLKKLGKLLAHPDKIDAERLAELAIANCECRELRPTGLQRVFNDEALTVFRPTNGSKVGALPQPAKLSLVDALKSLCGPFQGADDVRVKFKIIHIARQDEHLETVAYYQAAGRLSQGTVQQSATWHCRWRSEEEGKSWKLAAARVEDFEEVVNHENRAAWLVDCTEYILGGNRSYREQLRYGIDHWRSRLHLVMGLSRLGHHGLAVGDVNGDGLDDVYICQPGGLPNRLFIQQGDGTAQDFSTEAGVDLLDESIAALLLDLDNDGDQDLIVGASRHLLLMSNDGQGRFRHRKLLPLSGTPTSLSAADYDQDGLLDIYISTYWRGEQREWFPAAAANDEMAKEESDNTVPEVYHDANNGGANIMLHNGGEFRFSFVDDGRSGLAKNNWRFSFATSWEDYDNDGDLDLYVANDYGRNCLYRNDGQRFVEVATEANVEDLAAGMSVSWGDYNNDGWMDLYVGNMFSSAGNRITGQQQFKPGIEDQQRQKFRRHARGNTLYENNGDGTFRDVSEERAVTMGRWAWASNFVDLNNDGWQDLFVVNGFVTQQNPDDL